MSEIQGIDGDEIHGDDLGEELSGDDFGDIDGDVGDMEGDELGADETSGDDVGLFRRKRRRASQPSNNQAAERQRAYQRRLVEERERGRREAMTQLRRSQPQQQQRRTFGGKTVKSTGYTKGRVQSVGFVQMQMAPGAVADITTRPQTLFRGTRLVIPSAIAANVVIEDIKVGRNSQFAASGGQPGEAFKDTATGDNVSLDTARPGMDITLKVQNVGATALDFRATLFGDVVE